MAINNSEPDIACDIPAAIQRDFNGNNSLEYISGTLSNPLVKNRNVTTKISGI